MKPFAPTPGEPEAACRAPHPPALRRGIEAFNAGDYFASHDIIEPLWRAEPAAVRDLYKGVIQFAAALHHDARGNRAGALRLLERGAAYMARTGPMCHGLDVRALVEQVLALHDWLRRAPDNAPIPAQRIPRIALPERP